MPIPSVFSPNIFPFFNLFKVFTAPEISAISVN